MPVIHLETLIHAPPELVFDLERSVDVHEKSTSQTNERAVAGVTTGLLELGDEVTWEARHLGIRQRLSVRMTAFDRPRYFQDVMLKGAFASMVHDHEFHAHPDGTRMVDRFEFTSPLGILGRVMNRVFLTGYMRRVLVQRNAIVKQLAEADAGNDYAPAP